MVSVPPEARSAPIQRWPLACAMRPQVAVPWRCSSGGSGRAIVVDKEPSRIPSVRPARCSRSQSSDPG
jgi:hypothetical protein